MPASTKQPAEYGWGMKVPFDSLNEPGTYICDWSGHMMRVPGDSLKSGRSPLMMITGKEPLFLTKISDDPFIPISKARLLAANCDLEVNF